MQRLSQSATEPGFVQDPYPFYDRVRAAGPLVWWEEFDLPVSASHGLVSQLLRDRRFGRECPAELAPEIPEHLAPFYAVEAHSMLELEPPRHTRLRGLVLRAFTSRRIAALEPEIVAMAQGLVDGFPDGPFDLLEHFAQPLPVRIIARLMGDDLISHLIAAEEDGERLSSDELITTLILLLNAGHEATVHTLGNGIKTLLETGHRPSGDPLLIEEVLRHDPPLHMFTRYALEDMEVAGHAFRRGDQVGLLLGGANRDPEAYDAPEDFVPDREGPANVSFGAGLHFCVGAPLARLEIELALRVLFERFPNLQQVDPPRYANLYPFHGLERLMVRC